MARVLLLTFVMIAGCFCVFFFCRWLWSIRWARNRGLYPDRNKATLFDVRRLIIEKENDLAIRLYMDLYRVDFSRAEQAVAELERSIEEKNSRN